MPTYVVKENQLLNDIAIEYYGDHDRGMVDLLARNTQLLGPTANVFAGDVLNVGNPINRDIINRIGGATVSTRRSEDIYRGIGYDVISECSTEEEDLIDMDNRFCPRNAMTVG